MNVFASDYAEPFSVRGISSATNALFLYMTASYIQMCEIKMRCMKWNVLNDMDLNK